MPSAASPKSRPPTWSRRSRPGPTAAGWAFASAIFPTPGRCVSPPGWTMPMAPRAPRNGAVRWHWRNTWAGVAGVWPPRPNTAKPILPSLRTAPTIALPSCCATSSADAAPSWPATSCRGRRRSAAPCARRATRIRARSRCTSRVAASRPEPPRWHHASIWTAARSRSTTAWWCPPTRAAPRLRCWSTTATRKASRCSSRR